MIWAALTFAACLLISGAVAWKLASRNAGVAQAALAARADRVSQEIKSAITLYQYGLRGARGAIITAGEDGLTREVFRRYSESRNIALEFPGAGSFGFIRRVPKAEEEDFVRRTRLDGAPQFTVKQITPHDGDRYIVQYIEPAETNDAAFGGDLASETIRREGAERAMLSGEVTLTAPIALVQQRRGEPQAFLLLIPIYRPGLPVDTSESRMRALFGWAAATLSMTDVFATIRVEADALHVALADVTPGARDDVFFSLGTSDLAAALAPEIRTLDIFGRTWRIQTAGGAKFVSALNLTNPRSIFLSGAAVALLLAGFVGVAHANREQRRRTDAEDERLAAQFQASLERRVQEQTAALTQVNSLLAGVMEAASEVAIIATDVDGTIRIFNTGAERMLGYTAAEVVGKQTPALIHLPEEVAARGAELTKIYGIPIEGFRAFVHVPELEGAETREWTYVRKNGGRLLVSLVATAMRDERGEIMGYLGIAIDITAHKKTMDALAAAKVAADAANRAKSQFLAMMSHELRTPMTGVLGLADLLMDSSLTEDQQKLLRTQITSANALLDLLNDVLDFAKIESGHVELEKFDFDVRATVEDVGATIAPLASERGNTIQIEVAPDVNEAFLGDGKRYRQILMNLVGNANKFTADGHIDIHITQKEIGRDRFEISTTVKDTGVGIAPDGLQQLFQPFVQEDVSTSRKFGGTGLGLAISKQLVELMGGRIWAESVKDAGSTFGFTAMLAAGDAAKVESTAAAHRRAPLAALALPVASRPLKILVAEDNDTNRLLLVTILKRMKHDVRAVENGALAVEEVSRENFDIILMDMQMPVMDGPAAVRLIRGMAGPVSGIPIIALTADAISENQRGYIAQGVNAVITKPVNWRQLSREMETLTATRGDGTASAADEIALSGPVTAPGELPVIDEAFLGEMTDVLGLDVFAPMIDSFISNALTYGKELQRVADDVRTAKKAAHALKGLSAQFGALSLSDVARQIEVEAKTPAEIRAKLPELEAIIAATNSHALAWRAKRTAAG